MRIAYLILTHGMPDQLGRQIDALTDDETDFYVHVDRKVPVEPFLAHRAPNVLFLDRRVPVYWGQWQLVEATLRLIRTALERGRDYDYLVLLSASCYPIRSRAYIRRFLTEHQGDEFISTGRLPNAGAGNTISRLDRFFIRSDQSRLEFLRRVAWGFPVRRKSGRLLSKRWALSRDWRRELGSLIPYGGSTWWALTGDTCRYIDAFARREARVMRFFENARSPDEIIFQTILANSPLAPRMRRSLTYTDWSAGGRHPVELTERHLAWFAEPGPAMADGPNGPGEVCFARKFPDDGGRLARLVDDMVRQRETAEPGDPAPSAGSDG